MTEEIRSAIREFIGGQYAAETAISEIDDETSLRDAGIIDSVGVLPLVVFLEERFSIRVDDAEVLPENLDSISRLVGFVQRKTSAETKGE